MVMSHQVWDYAPFQINPFDSRMSRLAVPHKTCIFTFAGALTVGLASAAVLSWHFGSGELPNEQVRQQARLSEESELEDAEDEIQKWLWIFWPGEARGFRNLAKELHGPSHLRSIRGGINFTWPDVDETIRQAGHERCTLIRDNWSCVGSRYRKTLQATRVYQHRPLTFDLLSLPPTKILAVGNSLLAELIITVICNHNWTAVFGHQKKNSLIAHNANKQITLVLFSNDHIVDGSPPAAATELMRQAKLSPDLVILGGMNKKDWEQAYDRPHRLRESLANEFPKAAILDFPGKHIGDSCPSMDRKCRCASIECITLRAKAERGEHVFFRSHECIPGPILRYAEHLVSLLHVARRSSQSETSYNLVNAHCLGMGRNTSFKSASEGYPWDAWEMVPWFAPELFKKTCVCMGEAVQHLAAKRFGSSDCFILFRLFMLRFPKQFVMAVFCSSYTTCWCIYRLVQLIVLYGVGAF